MHLKGDVTPARLEALVAKRAARGLQTPMVDERPELFDDLQLAWDAWEELSLSRHWRIDGSPQGIAHSEIGEWLDLNLIRDDDARRDLYWYIKTMDLAWLSIRKTTLSKKTKTRGNTSRSHRRQKRQRRR